MLPILAQLAREAMSWPAPLRPLDDDWLEDRARFQHHRRNEHPDRPKAVRALVLYPLNALVEDQMVRLRKALDSDDAQDVMGRLFNGNRIFFGRYTGKSPVTGFLSHSRKSKDEAWKKRNARARKELKTELQRYQSIQQRLAAENDPDLRYIFPTTDGAELISRWDMQATPPDILVTNQSILNAMLVREVDDPILSQTRAWLMENEDARFYLVLDELHLIRGSAGAEMAGLLKVLLERLGLSDPAHAHKLRILASSASLPMDKENARASIDYLKNMFGDAGTAGAKDIDEAWEQSVVTGSPIKVERPKVMPSRESLADLARALEELDHRRSPRELFDRFLAAAASIPGSTGKSPAAMLEEATATAAKMLDFALQNPEIPGSKIPRTIGDIGNALFEAEDRLAVRGSRTFRSMSCHPNSLRSAQPSRRCPASGCTASSATSRACSRPSIARMTGPSSGERPASSVGRTMTETLTRKAARDSSRCCTAKPAATSIWAASGERRIPARRAGSRCFRHRRNWRSFPKAPPLYGSRMLASASSPSSGRARGSRKSRSALAEHRIGGRRDTSIRERAS